jgi:hypothetical protein
MEEINIDLLVENLMTVVKTKSPIELAALGIIVKKVSVSPDTSGFEKFGMFLDFQKETTVTIEMKLRYTDEKETDTDAAAAIS